MKHKTKIFLALPCYGGQINAKCFLSILNLQSWSIKNNIELKVQTLVNELLIPRGRNTLVGIMMDDVDFSASHILFIDADIGFEIQNIERLLNADKDIVCGIYPKKLIQWEKLNKILQENQNIPLEQLKQKLLSFNLNIDNPNEILIENGFCKVSEAATGMMLIKRNVFEIMKKKFPERKYQPDNVGNLKRASNNFYDFFPTGIYPPNSQRYLSEDYYFSRLWRECGGEIWADILMPLTHTGLMEFKGSVGINFKKN